MWAIFRYRRRSDEMPVQTQYHTLTEIIYTVVPILIVLGLFWPRWWWRKVKVTAVEPNPSTMIHVYAFQWGWEFEYPNGVKVIGQTTDAPTMVVPTGETTRIYLRSYDVLHGFYVPEFNFSRYASPGLLDQLRPQRAAQRRLPGPVHPAVRPLPLPDVLQRPFGVPVRLPDAGCRSPGPSSGRTPTSIGQLPADLHANQQRDGAQLLWQLRQLWQREHRQHRRCALR